MQKFTFWVLTGFSSFALHATAATVHYLTDADDLRSILQQNPQNPFRYPGVWSVAEQDAFTADLKSEIAPDSTHLSSAPVHQPRSRQQIQEKPESSSQYFLRKVQPLLPVEAEPARMRPETEATASQEGESQSAGRAASTVYYLHPFLLLTTPFLASENDGDKVFPGETAIRYRTTTESEVLQPYEEIEIASGSDQGVKPGDLFKIYEVGEDYSSFSGATVLGRLVRISGMAEVKRVNARSAVAVLIRCFGSILPESRAAPLGDFPSVRATGYAPISGQLRTGRIIWATPPDAIPQPFSKVIIDRGADHGFHVGDFAFIFDPHNGKMTDKMLGDAVVLHSDPHSATLLLQDLEPGVIAPGDFVVAGYSVTP